MAISNALAIARLAFGLVADTAFVLASKAPHTAHPSEIQKDKQLFINRTISGVHLFSSVVVYGLTAGELLSAWSNGDVLGAARLWGWQEWAGVAGMFLGGSMRLWCYRTLGRFFTFNLAIRKGHRLITNGPYALLRHPSYTGMLAMLMGLNIRYTSPRSFLLPILGQNALTASIFFACTAPTLSLVRRIKQEEAMLEKEFGVEWKTYCKTTWRLVPFIW